MTAARKCVQPLLPHSVSELGNTKPQGEKYPTIPASKSLMCMKSNSNSYLNPGSRAITYNQSIKGKFVWGFPNINNLGFISSCSSEFHMLKACTVCCTLSLTNESLFGLLLFYFEFPLFLLLQTNVMRSSRLA